MNIGIIPARGGSKRIPGKNIKPFAGKPIVAWVIEAALASGLFDRLIVSTDDKKIAEVVTEYGAEVPFMRPAELSDDHTGIIEVVQHAIAWLKNEHVEIDNVCCMLATAPFLRADVLSDALAQLIDTKASYALSVTSFPFPIQRAIRINSADRVEAMWPENIALRSQDLEEAFHDAGQFYWGTRRAFERGEPIFSSGSLPIRLPRYQVQDIDTPEDWKLAELMFNAMRDAGDLAS
jgi:N-acylneuraminate cytidylyltransferase